MIDGIKLNARITDDLDNWQELTSIKLKGSINKVTNERVIKVYQNTDSQNHMSYYTGNFGSYKVKVKQCDKFFDNGNMSKYTYLNLSGSLHKSYSKGENYTSFTWDNLQCEIDYLANTLQLDASKTKIDSIEVGLNLPLQTSVHSLLFNNVIAFKGKQFNQYDDDSKLYGLYCPLTQYILKLYNKSQQYKLVNELLRIEVKTKKMEAIKKPNIAFLEDLRNKDKVYELKELLLKKWDEVLVYDDTIDASAPEFRQNDRDLLLNASNIKFWQRLKTENYDRYYTLLKRYNKLSSNSGRSLKLQIHNLIISEWDSLF